MKQHDQNCPIAATTNIIGDRWTLLILREAFRGTTRFGELQRNTGAAKTVLSDRLNNLVKWGLLETVDVGEKGSRYAYRLTEKGTSLSTVLIAIHQWGNTHLYGDTQEPVVLIEKSTGAQIPALVVRSEQGSVLAATDISFAPGPGARKTG